MNFADGCVRERTRRFHVASCAFMRPAFRPTRGSGFGAVAEVLTLGDVPSLAIDVELGCVQAAVSRSPRAIGSADRRTTVECSVCLRARGTNAIANTSR